MSSANHSNVCFTYKIVLIGEVGVGKTSLFLQVRDDKFYGNTMSSIGIDSCCKNLKVDGENVKMIIVDTAGIERFRTLTRSYFRNSHAVFYVYSVDDPCTLAKLNVWHQDVCTFAPTALRFLIGNKCDLMCGITKDMVEYFAACHGCECVFLVSSKTGQGIPNLLQAVCKSLVLAQSQHQYMENNSWLDQSVHVNDGSFVKTTSCCS